MQRRLFLESSLAAGLFLGAVDPASAKESLKDKTREATLDGQAVYLGEVLRVKHKLELLDPALDDVVVLETTAGDVWPILPTESGLFYFRDERVRNRPMRLRARLFEDLHVLEIIDRHSLVDGKPNEIYYWCEICAIQMYHLKQCDCCQGPIELREHPVGEEFRLKNQ